MLRQNNFIRSYGSLFVAMMYVFLYLPITVLVLYSFNAGGFPDAWKGFSMQWYSTLFESVEIWRAFQNSIIVAVMSGIFSVSMAVLFIHGVTFFNRRYSELFFLNAMIPDIVLAIGLLTLFSYCFIPLGLATLIVSHTLLGLGFVVPVIKSRYDELNKQLIEASLDLGASSMYTFFHVVVPFLSPAILVGFLLAVIISFDDFLIAFFCSGSSVQTLSLYIFSMIRSGISPIVNALSTLMLVLSGIFVLIISFVQKKYLKV